MYFNFPIIFWEYSRFRSGARKSNQVPPISYPESALTLSSGTPVGLPIPLDKGNADSGKEKWTWTGTGRVCVIFEVASLRWTWNKVKTSTRKHEKAIQNQLIIRYEAPDGEIFLLHLCDNLSKTNTKIPSQWPIVRTSQYRQRPFWLGWTFYDSLIGFDVL